MKTDRRTPPRGTPDDSGAEIRRRSLRPLLGALLLLLLGWSSTAPARADITVDGNNSSAASPYVINYPVNGTVWVNAGGVLDIVGDAQITGGGGGGIGVIDLGGAVTISGGSISSPSDFGVYLDGGTLDISGGSISGSYAVRVRSGAVNISGGVLSASDTGVNIHDGTVNISGGSISSSATSGTGVIVESGTLYISGGSISSYFGLAIGGGTVSISGGSISGRYGVGVGGGTVSISGGSISATLGGVLLHGGGQVSIFGCNLQMLGGQLFGSLQDGSPIDSATFGVGAQNLVNQDTGLLRLTCPTNVVAPAAPGACSASVNPGTATASDGCSTPPTVVGVRGDGQALSDPYPVGVTTIAWTAMDVAHGSTSCYQTITVTDTEKPTIACPGNMTVPATSASGAVVSFTVPASDNCAGVSVQTTPASGSLFTLGPTTVNGIATDAAGNTNTCSFTVTVEPRADLSVMQTASPSSVAVGKNLTYTIVVTNNGPQAAQGVVLTDPLPANSNFINASGSPSGGTVTTSKTGTVTWSVNTLASGQSATLTLSLAVKATTKPGTVLTNTASVSSNSPVDPNPGNNTATTATSVVKGNG
jgi:uncharacterized repeat protein (TIGR01451 family)